MGGAFGAAGGLVGLPSAVFRLGLALGRHCAGAALLFRLLRGLAREPCVLFGRARVLLGGARLVVGGGLQAHALCRLREQGAAGAKGGGEQGHAEGVLDHALVHGWVPWCVDRTPR